MQWAASTPTAETRGDRVTASEPRVRCGERHRGRGDRDGRRGGAVDVTIGGRDQVAVALEAPSGGRRAWTAELTAPAPGTHTITATADRLEGGPSTASVTIKVVGPKSSGRWEGEGEVEMFDGTPERNKITGGSFIVLYDIDWFRMLGANPVFGTTDNWDLIDKERFRIRGTYHAAGEKNERGEVMPWAWVDYDAVMQNGYIIEPRGPEED